MTLKIPKLWESSNLQLILAVGVEEHRRVLMLFFYPVQMSFIVPLYHFAAPAPHLDFL